MEKIQKQKEKKVIGKYIRLGILAVLVVLLAVMPMLASRSKAAEDRQASVLSATVEYKNIETQIIGGGQLSSSGALNVRIPENVKLTEYLVGNGDTVQEGDAIAKVDKVSVMTAITEVQETLDYLAEEIADASGDTASTTVKALAGGTVKVIYAKAGQSVQDVMLEHGALAILSLDGTMAVRIEKKSALEVGDTVCVAFPDGTEADGRVKTNLDGVLTITMEDDDYAVGTKVIVSTEEGRKLGAGELYIFSPWSATAYSGTVSNVLVKENDTVAVGRTLFSLKDTGNSAEFQRLIDQRQEYEELMQELFTMYRTETITAPCDGIVTGVDEDGAYLLSGSEQGWVVNLLSLTVPDDEESKFVISLLSNSDDGSGDGNDSNPDGNGGNEDSDSSSDGNGGNEDGDSSSNGDDGTEDGNSSSGDDGTEDGDSNSGSDNGTEDGDSGSGGDDGSGGDESGSDENPGTEEDAEEKAEVYTGYVAQVVEIQDGRVKVKQTLYSYTITDLSSLPRVFASSSDLTIEKEYTSGLIQTGTLAVGDVFLIVVDSSGTVKAISKDAVQLSQNASGQQSGTPSGGGMTSGGGMGGSGAVQVFEPYSLEKVTVASVTSQEHMTVSITVDELDITKIYVGQPAVVSVDALGGEQFGAEITKISNSGENEGGNSKFAVEVTLGKSGEMLPGMYSSAFITLETRENIPCVPVAALGKQGVESVLYTSYDEDHGLLGDPVVVTIGASDGENAEILDGFAVGEICYYEYYDTYVGSDAPQQQGRGFNFGRMLGR